MSDLAPYNPGGGELARRDSRRVGRSISQSRASTELRIAHSFNSEQITMAKLDILTAAAGTASGHIARLYALTQRLELEAPGASDHLAAIRSIHLQMVAQELESLTRTLRYQ